MAKSTEYHQTIAHYHEGVFTTLFYASRVEMGDINMESFVQDMKAMEEELKSLNEIDPTLFPSPNLAVDDCQKMVSAKAGRVTWKLVPINPAHKAKFMLLMPRFLGLSATWI